MFDLSGKTALVTGASGGIGMGIARCLHAAGARVGLAGRRIKVLETLAAELGTGADVFAADLATTKDTDMLAKEVESRFDGLDILVNNAGITRDNLAMRMSDADWDMVLAVNLTAPFRLTRAMLRGMLKRRYGRIINITSIVGAMGNAGQSNYAAAKAGLTGMSKALAHEVAARGITVNCIAPGFIDTPMTDALSGDQKSALAATIPAKKLGTTEDVAAACLYLASSEGQYVTGQTFHVNGGMIMI